MTGETPPRKFGNVRISGAESLLPFQPTYVIGSSCLSKRLSESVKILYSRSKIILHSEECWSESNVLINKYIANLARNMFWRVEVYNVFVMSSTYLKFLSRNKLYTFIEVFGLSVALGFVILLASYARTEFSVGANQPLSKQLYAVGSGDYFGMTVGTSEEFFPSIPEIKEWTRLAEVNGSYVTVGDDYYTVKEVSVDTNFFRLFDYRLSGCPRARVLENEEEVIISESFSKKLFGNEEPVGRTIDNNGVRRVVVGVIQDFGPSDVFRDFDLFTSIKVFEKSVARMDNFGSTIPIVRLEEGTDPEKVRQGLLKCFLDYWDNYAAENDGSFLWGASVTRLDKVYFSDLGAYNTFRKGDRKQVGILFVVALALLVSAIFNYINLTVAQTGKRAKEMATRRLLGEGSSSIVWRFLFESLAFTFGCFAVGCLLAYWFKPFFDNVLSADIVLRPNLAAVVWAVLSIVAISVVSAILPVIMISRFKPVNVVKGEFRFKNKMVFSKVFIALQFVFGTVLIAMAVTMTAQLRYLAGLQVGYNTKDIIQLYDPLGVTGDSKMVLMDRLKTLPQVADAGFCLSSPFRCGANGIHNDDGQLAGWLRMPVLDTTSFRILGFSLIEKYSGLSSGKIVLTETSKKKLGASEDRTGLGYNGNEYVVCGIVPDFRAGNALFEPMEDEQNAIKIIDASYKYANILILKITGDRADAMAAVKDAFKTFAKEVYGIPADAEAFYLDEQWVDELKGTRNTMLLVMSFMFVAILISVLGLFAMSLYFTERQSRQIALRKVFGADVGSVVRSLSGSFMAMGLAAEILAVPLALWGIKYYLQGFHTRIAFPWWAVALAVLISLLVSFISVLGQTYEAATRNPVKTLSRD